MKTGSFLPIYEEHYSGFHAEQSIDDELAAWFSPLTVHHAPDGATMLTVPVRDQVELHGLLIKIRDLNLTIIAIVNI